MDDRATSTWTWRCMWPAAVPFVLPFVFFFIVEATVHYLMPHEHRKGPELKAYDFLSGAFERFAHDVEGRLLFGTSTGFIRVVAMAGIFLALYVLVRTFGYLIGTVILIASTFIGASFGYGITSENIVLISFVYTPLELAQSTGVVFPGTIDRLKSTVTLSMVIGIGACGALFAGCSAVAVRAAQPKDLTTERLRKTTERLQERMRYLKFLVLCAAILLVLLIVSTKVLVAWPRGLMNYDEAKSFGALTGALVNHWGAIATGLLLCAGVPALLSVQTDIKRAEEAATKDKETNENWRRKNHLEFELMSVLAAVIAAAAPLLTGPTVDVLGVLLRGG
jgi:hypothetical protein